MSLTAIEPKRQHETCKTCGGACGGYVPTGERGFAGLPHDEWQDCPACDGHGDVYTGPSGEPEDYPERVYE